MGRDMGRGQDKGGVYVQLSYEAKKKKRRNCDVSVCSKHKRGITGHSYRVRIPCYDLELVYGLWRIRWCDWGLHPTPASS